MIFSIYYSLLVCERYTSFLEVSVCSEWWTPLALCVALLLYTYPILLRSAFARIHPGVFRVLHCPPTWQTNRSLLVWRLKWEPWTFSINEDKKCFQTIWSRGRVKRGCSSFMQISWQEMRQFVCIRWPSVLVFACKCTCKSISQVNATPSNDKVKPYKEWLCLDCHTRTVMLASAVLC